MTDQPGSENAFGRDTGSTAARDPVEAAIADLRQRGGVFVEAVRATRMAMVLTDPALPGNPIVFANQSFLDLSGYGMDEVLGRQPFFMNGPDTDPADAGRFRRILEMDRDGVVETVQYAKDGRRFVATVLLSAFKDDDGHTRHHVLSWADVTRRVDAEEEAHLLRTQAALQESEERFRAFVTSSSDAVYWMSPDWSELRRLQGRSFLADTDEPNQSWMDRYIDPADRDTLAAAINKAIRTKSLFELEHRVRRADGSLGWSRSRAVPMLDAQGGIIEWIGTATDMTEQKRAEDALRESEARHRLLIESWTQAIWETDPQGVVVADSPSWRAYTGQTLDEWLGYGWLNVIHPEDRAYAERQWREAVAARGLVNAEFRLRAADGGWRWTNVRAAPVLDGDGNIRKWAGMNIDIDARKRAEQALRESEERYRTLFESIDEGYLLGEVIFDDNDEAIDIRFLEANPAAVRLAGRDFTGQRMREIDPQYEQSWYEAYGRVALTGEPLRAERYAGTHGRWFDFRLSKVGPPESRCVASVFRDITEHKNAERALRASEERYRELFERMDEGFAVMQAVRDAQGNVTDFRHLARNPASERVTGLGSEKVVGRLVGEVLPPEDARYWIDAYAQVFLSGQPARFEHFIPALDRWFAVKVTPYGDDGVGVFYENFTDRKRAEEKLREGEARQAFLLRLSDALRPLSDVDAMADVACGLLAGHLQGSRALYTMVENGAGEEVGKTYGEQVDRGGPMPRRHEFAAFGEGVVSVMRAGETLVIRDTDTDARIAPAEREAFRAVDCRASITVPLVKGGRIAAALTIQDDRPRNWRDGDIAIVEAVAERTWAAVERAHAEAALRQSQERQAFLLELSDALRPLDDPLAVQNTAMKLLAERLDVMRASYFELEEDQDSFRLTARFENQAAPIPDRMRLSDLSLAFLDVNPGRRILAVADTSIKGDLVPDPEAYARIGIGAWAGVPLVKNGQLVAWLGVHSATSREWSTADLTMLEDVAERTLAAVERARAEQALVRSEAKYRILFNSIDEGFCIIEMIFDEQGKPVDYAFLESNPVFEKQAGFKIARGRRMRDIAPEHEQHWFDIYGRIALTGEPARFQNEAASFGIIYDVYAFRVDDPALRRVAVVFRNITESRRAEQALRASEERLRQFGEASQDVLWIRDARTLQWTYLTPAFETIYGLSRDEALAGNNYRSWMDLIVPEDRERVTDIIRRVRNGEHMTFDYRIRRPSDGAVRWLRNTDFPILDENGTVAMIGGIGHDFTEMRETELRLETLVKGIPQLVWRAADGGQWTWASPQWVAYTGLSVADSLGQGWLGALHPDDRKGAQEAWNQAAGKGGMEVEYRLCHPADGEYRWFQTRATPVRDNAGTIIEWLGTSTDIHDLRALQERQHVLVAELQHRTRNLMGVIRATSYRTGETSTDYPDFQNRFDDRLEALARVQGLLSRLSDTNRVAFDELILTELKAMQGAAERTTLEGPAGIRLRSSMVQTLAMALHELATNAVKYGALGQPGGHLSVTWRMAEPDRRGRPRLHIDWRESGVTMPPIGAGPQGGGQGRELIERALPYQLSAETSFELGPDGVHCTITVPISESTMAGAAHG